MITPPGGCAFNCQSEPSIMAMHVPAQQRTPF
jgi:hypothetical protein